MKRVLGSMLAFLLGATTAAAQFEGVADMKITTTGAHATSGAGKTYVSKAGWRSEMEMSSPEMAKATGVPSMKWIAFGKLADPDKVYMLNDKMKTYAVLDAKKTAEMAESLSKREHKYTVKKLGRDTVAGLACENALVTEEGTKTQIEACMSKEFMTGNWLKAMERGRRGGGDFMKALKDAGLEGYPIRMVTKSKDDGGTTTMELTKVERRSIPASMFEVPPGYKETSMMGLWAQTPEQAKQMEQAQKQMEEAMKNMTPEERKRMEEMMKAMGQQKK